MAFDKPSYLGLTNLKLAKLHMYDLYCKNFLRTYHGENNLTLHQKNTEFFSFRRTRKQGEDLTI